ncbi:MAG: hypothetical protein HYX69_17010 [Planctomycetia bacterium]|nr:hypothetical protein [Planctomycetia bacterium]
MRGALIAVTVFLMSQAGAAGGGGVTPAAELRLAVDDLSTRVAVTDRPVTRYLSLYAIPPARRRAAAAVASFGLNSVSHADTIAALDVVPGTEGRLLRFSLRRLRIDAAAWEAIAAEDPYWHLRTQVVDPNTGKVREVVTDGGWVGLVQAARLREMAASIGALLRADHFIARAGTTENGGHYYRLAGVPEREQQFHALLGIDAATTGRLRSDQGANLIRSGVTFKVRRVVRRQGPLGAAWSTFDVERVSPDRDPIRNPLGFQYDAGEHIAAKRNGLHVFALFDRQGRRQDAVPDRIAKDALAVHGSGVIAPLLSCVRCHSERGLRPFANDQRRLLAGRVELFAEREEDAERLAGFYERDLEKLLRRDREDYGEAVAAATGGMQVTKLAEALAEAYGTYVDELVSPAQAARELGLATSELTVRLRASNDPVILALCEGLSVQRQQWESAFATAALLAMGG